MHAHRAGILALLGSWILSGCGGESTSHPFSNGPDGGDASVSGGGSGSGAGGSASAAGGSSGANASGGAPGAGGSAEGGLGTGGTSAEGGPCAPPALATDTALCLRFSPETIVPRADKALDEWGVLVVQVFDTPNPPDKNASQVALAERVLPANSASGGEIALSALRPMRLVHAFPSTVYVRAFFVDNPDVLAQGNKIAWGVWVGGVNLADGIQKNEPLLPVPLEVGRGNLLDLTLTALRRLDVTVKTTATPIGDGQGKLDVIAVDKPDPGKKPAVFGSASTPCADVTAGDVTLTGVVVGDGPYYVTGVLNDLGTPGDLPPGSLVSLEPTDGGFQIPTELTYGKGNYRPSVTIDLNYVVPLGADAGTPGPNSCRALGIDAGP
jgi:hypothetical protein